MSYLTPQNIAEAVALGTGVAVALGALGHALAAIPFKPAQAVGRVLNALYSNWGSVVAAFRPTKPEPEARP